MGKVKAMLMDQLEKAAELRDLWDDLEESGTAEMAAYYVACEQLNIDPMNGFELLRVLSEHEKRADREP